MKLSEFDQSFMKSDSQEENLDDCSIDGDLPVITVIKSPDLKPRKRLSVGAY